MTDYNHWSALRLLGEACSRPIIAWNWRQARRKITLWLVYHARFSRTSYVQDHWPEFLRSVEGTASRRVQADHAESAAARPSPTSRLLSEIMKGDGTSPFGEGMIAGRLTHDEETARLQALEDLEILGTEPEKAFDDLTQLAAFICGTPVSLISLVGKEHQFFKSAHNFPETETPRSQSFCAHAMGLHETLVVPDAQRDARFVSNPLVTGDPKIRFYAGSPIYSDGHVLGALCVIDKEPRQLSDEQRSALEALARQTSSLLDARRTALHNKRLRAEAESAHASLQEAFDAANLGAWYYDPVRNIIGGDSRVKRMFGLNVGVAPADVRISSIVEEDRTRVGEEFAASIAGAPFNTKYRVAVDGEIRWLHSKATPHVNEHGTVRMVGVSEDVTREENLAAELAKANERLAVAQDASGAVSFDWNVIEDTLIWNGAIALGRPAVELDSAATYFTFVHEDDRPMLQEVVRSALSEGRGYYAEFRFFWPDGSVRWVSTSARPMRNGQGEVDSVLGVNLDITERRQSEKALLHSEKLAAVGRLASVISHEINNPLEAVTNLLYIVRTSPNVTQQDRENLELADRELARVSQIAAQTLRFHRNLSRPGTIEAGVMVHEMLTLYRTRLAASNIEIKLDIGENVTFDAFEGDIRQVLNNLIGNAFDAMRKGGRLVIRARCSMDFATGQNGASIMICDNGPGIPEKARAHVFEAFYSTKGMNGTGLGLWISKRIVHKHKGHLHFRTRTGEIHGTSFRMWVPSQMAQTASESWA